MTDFLVSHALQNVWCTPDQDKQVIFKPAKLTRPRGDIATTNVLWDTIPLPTPKERYHVYQIGQLHAPLIGLMPDKMVWQTVSENMRRKCLYSDIYTESGLQLPRFQCWFLVNEDGNVLLAVQDQPRLVELDNTPIFVRLYSNAYFQSERSKGKENVVFTEGRVMDDVNSMLLMQRRYRDRKAAGGMALAFVDGIYVEDFVPMTLPKGALVEYVHDTTVKNVVDFKISDLDNYVSILDNKRKYLLNYKNQIDSTIDYRDDLEIYLLNLQGTKWKGSLYHRNQEDAVRMVTHKDYGIPVSYVTSKREAMGLWKNTDQLTVRMFIRNSGYQRPLVDEHHRIKELYRLPALDLRKALLGIDSVVPFWHAPQLELSMYPKIMRSKGSEITVPMVQDAYGYNATAKLIGDSPLKVKQDSVRRYVDLPVELRNRSTIYEYNSSGRLLGFYSHSDNINYVPRNAACVLVEGIVGVGGTVAALTQGQKESPIDGTYNYRFYTAPVWRGEIRHAEWKDVTGDLSKYTISNGKVTWATGADTFTAVGCDDRFLAYQFTMAPIDGLLKFSIIAEQTQVGQTFTGPLYIAPGQLDLWLNGAPLIENLDYFVKWPQVIITNKEYIDQANSRQSITVRATGFCKSDMTREEPAEFGFVEHGLLSRNRRYNVRDDKVVRIIVEGTLRHRDELIFSENDQGIQMQNIRNGAPYLITEPVIPLRGLTTEDTYSMRAKSKANDAYVEDYLTMKLPEPAKPPTSPIPRLYQVYSPFSSKVMYDMLNGLLDISKFSGAGYYYSDKEVRDALADYVYLLDYDPVRQGVNSDYVSIHPHNLYVETVLNIYQYSFLQRAIKIFLDDKVDINRFVRLKEGYV